MLMIATSLKARPIPNEDRGGNKSRRGTGDRDPIPIIIAIGKPGVFESFGQINVRLEIALAIFARKRFTANKIFSRLLDDADQHLFILA